MFRISVYREREEKVGKEKRLRENPRYRFRRVRDACR